MGRTNHVAGEYVESEGGDAGTPIQTVTGLSDDGGVLSPETTRPHGWELWPV